MAPSKRRQRAGVTKLSPAQASVLRTLGPLEGKRLPGGCDRCDAYQRIEAAEAGIWKIVVYHDDECPFLKTRTEHLEKSA